MEKSVHTEDYGLVVRLLKESRREAGLTQVQLAEMLRQSQSFVSKYENGDTRLDILQLRTVCGTLGVTLAEFVDRLEEAFEAKAKDQKSRARSSSTRR